MVRMSMKKWNACLFWYFVNTYIFTNIHQARTSETRFEVIKVVFPVKKRLAELVGKATGVIILVEFPEGLSREVVLKWT